MKRDEKQEAGIRKKAILTSNIKSGETLRLHHFEPFVTLKGKLREESLG